MQCLIQDMAEIFAKFGIQNAATMLLGFLPRFLANRLLGFVDFFSSFFDWVNQEYVDQEKTYDPDHMRHYLDVYMRERKRADAEGDVNSSFYGKHGHWSYVNSMFDLFLAGSETTSTSLTFLLVKDRLLCTTCLVNLISL